MAWNARRALMATIALAVVLGLVGVIASLLLWQIMLVVGLTLSEAEIRAVRAARTLREFDRRVAVFRAAFAASIGLLLPVIAGPSWLIPVMLALAVATSATQLRRLALVALVSAASMSYLIAAGLLQSGLVEPLEPVGLSGGVSWPGSLAVALAILPVIAGFVFVRSERARRSRQDLERTVGELREAEEGVRRSQAEAQQLSESLSAEVERKTEELAGRNRALSIVNAISFALSEPFDDDAALRRAARLVCRLLGVDSVQVREFAHDESGGLEVFVGAEVGVDDLPRIAADVIDAAMSSGGVTRSTESDPGARPPYVIVPLVTQGQVRGSLTLVGEACEGWAEQELHLLSLIGREVGSALESARLYRAALALADREHLVTEVTALLSDGSPLHEQLDGLLTQLGAALSPAFVSVVSIEGGKLGPELTRWEPESEEPLSAEELSALTSLIPEHLGSLVAPRVLTADYTVTSLIRARFGEIVMAPVLTTPTELSTADGGDADAARPARSTPEATAVLVLAAPVESGWPAPDIEVTSRLASAIGHRLENERFIQFQQRRLEELAALAEIGAVIQAGADADRLYGDFAAALHHLIPFHRAYIARTRDGELSQVDVYTEQGRVRSSVEIHDGDADHPWFNAREAVTWVRGADSLPSFLPVEVRAGLTLPMRPKGQFLGAVILVGDETRPFSAPLAERAVEQLALAVDSTELYRQATERASRIEAHRNLANIVASAVDLQSAFDAFAEEIRWLIPFERAVMLAVDEDAGTVEQAATYPPVPDTELLSASLAGSVLSRVLGRGDAFVLVRSDEALRGLNWSLIGDDAVEVAAIAVRDGEHTVAIFALEHSGVADYQHLDLEALEEVAGLLAVTIDRLRLYERAEHAANHDLLTGLPNYRFLQERLATMRVDLENGRRSAVLMIDMDGLKLYNDTLGHDAGDRAIQRVAQELRGAVRGEDLVARTGGDEFVVVMEGVSQEEALAVSQRMHESLRDIHQGFGNAPVPVRISVGLAFAPEDGTRASELLEAADRAMYAAKFSGGDRTRATTGDLDAEVTPRAMRRRGNRIMELLNRAAIDGASGPERLAVALAQRYVVAVAIGRGLRVDTTDPLRMLVSAEASHHIEAPEGYRDQETALLLLDGLRAQWENQVDAADLQLSDLLPAAVRLAWEQIPPPVGPGLTAEQALGVVMNDPAYQLGPEVVELLRQSARTAEFERRRSRRTDAA